MFNYLAIYAASMESYASGEAVLRERLQLVRTGSYMQAYHCVQEDIIKRSIDVIYPHHCNQCGVDSLRA